MDECKSLAEGVRTKTRQVAAPVAPGGRPPPAAVAALGRAVQVDSIKPTLKPPGTKLLKLISDEPLSSFAFKFSLRRHSSGGRCILRRAAARRNDRWAAS